MLALVKKIFFSASLIAYASFAFASEQHAQMIDLLEKLKDKGYLNITKIELEDGIYEIKGYNNEGKKYEMNIDPKNMEIPPYKFKKKFSILDALKKAESLGYHSFKEIDIEDGKCEIIALNKKNQKMKLKADPNTGTIIERDLTWFSHFIDDLDVKHTSRKTHELKNLSCKEFLEIDDVYKPGAIYWASALASDDTLETASLYREDIHRLIPIIITECGKDEKASFWEKIKEWLSKTF